MATLATALCFIFPAIVVRKWGDTPEPSIQLQVFLDGPDTYWATSRVDGE